MKDDNEALFNLIVLTRSWVKSSKEIPNAIKFAVPKLTVDVAAKPLNESVLSLIRARRGSRGTSRGMAKK